MNVGVIGTGLMGSNHARVYTSLKDVDDVYVYDLDPARAEQVAKENECIATSSIDTLLECVDAVSVVVPTPHHFEVAKLCIEHSKHTLVEKPLCKTRDECRQLCAIANGASDLVLGVGHIERFNPVIHFLYESVENPKYISITRHNPGSDRITDTSVIEDLMIHDVDIIATLTQLNPERLPIAACGNDETYVAMIDNGYPIILSASRAATKKTREIYVIDGDRTFIGDLVDQTIRVYHKPDVYTLFATSGIVARVNIPRVEPLQVELSTFIWCINNKKHFPVSFDQGCMMIGLCDAIRKSNSKYIKMEEPQVKRYEIG